MKTPRFLNLQNNFSQILPDRRRSGYKRTHIVFRSCNHLPQKSLFQLRISILLVFLILVIHGSMHSMHRQRCIRNEPASRFSPHKKSVSTKEPDFNLGYTKTHCLINSGTVCASMYTKSPSPSLAGLSAIVNQAVLLASVHRFFAPSQERSQ